MLLAPRTNASNEGSARYVQSGPDLTALSGTGRFIYELNGQFSGNPQIRGQWQAFWTGADIPESIQQDVIQNSGRALVSAFPVKASRKPSENANQHTNTKSLRIEVGGNKRSPGNYEILDVAQRSIADANTSNLSTGLAPNVTYHRLTAPAGDQALHGPSASSNEFESDQTVLREGSASGAAFAENNGINVNPPQIGNHSTGQQVAQARPDIGHEALSETISPERKCSDHTRPTAIESTDPRTCTPSQDSDPNNSSSTASKAFPPPSLIQIGQSQISSLTAGDPNPVNVPSPGAARNSSRTQSEPYVTDKAERNKRVPQQRITDPSTIEFRFAEPGLRGQRQAEVNPACPVDGKADPVVPSAHDSSFEFGSLTVPQTFGALDETPDKSFAVWHPLNCHSAEAGYEDKTLGWISVSARADVQGVHAVLAPSSSQSATVLSGSVEELHSYLRESHSQVASIRVNSPATTDSQGQTGSSGNDSGRNAESRQYRSSPSSGFVSELSQGNSQPSLLGVADEKHNYEGVCYVSVYA
jgi:hypothetical protein